MVGGFPKLFGKKKGGIDKQRLISKNSLMAVYEIPDNESDVSPTPSRAASPSNESDAEDLPEELSVQSIDLSKTPYRRHILVAEDGPANMKVLQNQLSEL